jgi:hypothetical protein
MLWIYIGDRLNQAGPGSVGNASYVWLPMTKGKDGSYAIVDVPGAKTPTKAADY